MGRIAALDRHGFWVLLLFSAVSNNSAAGMQPGVPGLPQKTAVRRGDHGFTTPTLDPSGWPADELPVSAHCVWRITQGTAPRLEPGWDHAGAWATRRALQVLFHIEPPPLFVRPSWAHVISPSGMRRARGANAARTPGRGAGMCPAFQAGLGRGHLRPALLLRCMSPLTNLLSACWRRLRMPKRTAWLPRTAAASSAASTTAQCAPRAQAPSAAAPPQPPCRGPSRPSAADAAAAKARGDPADHGGQPV